VIDVDRLTKEYTLGARARGYTTLREAIRRLGRLAPWPPSRWPAVRALDDLSFHVAEGEAVGLIGRNGAGKSTALKVLSRITEADVGHGDRARPRGESVGRLGTGFHPS